MRSLILYASYVYKEGIHARLAGLQHAAASTGSRPTSFFIVLAAQNAGGGRAITPITRVLQIGHITPLRGVPPRLAILRLPREG